MLKQLGLAAPPRVMGHGSRWGHHHGHWGSCRRGLPCHTVCATGTLFSIRGVKKLPQSLGSLQRMELPWVRCSVWTAWDPSRLNKGMDAPRNMTNHPVQLPGELTPLISLQTHEVNHIAKTGCMYCDSHLCTWVQHWSSWVRSASLSSPHCTQEITKDMHRNAMSRLLRLSFLFSVRRMWNKWVLDLRLWNFWVIGDLCKFITSKCQTLPDITFGGCLLLMWILKREKKN